MAGDWLKVRLDLAEDPAVIGIADALGMDEDAVVGKLCRLWSWANNHTVDGNAPGVTAKWIDRYLRVDGFADAMVAVGWLTAGGSGIQIPKWELHNSQSAKARALAAKRVAGFKKKKRLGNAEANGQGNAVSVTQALPTALPREEKRREEKNTPPPPKGEPVAIPPEIDTPEFREAWSMWERHRSQKRSKLTPLTREQQLKQCVAWGVPRAVAAIECSIAKGWVGLFEARSPPPGSSGSSEAFREQFKRVAAEMDKASG